MLKLALIPKGEFVIREGEMANSMYFILKGAISVEKGGVKLAIL